MTEERVCDKHTGVCEVVGIHTKQIDDIFQGLSRRLPIWAFTIALAMLVGLLGYVHTSSMASQEKLLNRIDTKFDRLNQSLGDLQITVAGIKR
ncbi:MAG: hypothetical protein C4530_09985 [Desulfobacteraceae bacterium]|nr:MAG: hypothetical protein C4530_09985 [Desulfobacteraceae bacterium]